MMDQKKELYYSSLRRRTSAPCDFNGYPIYPQKMINSNAGPKSGMTEAIYFKKNEFKEISSSDSQKRNQFSTRKPSMSRKGSKNLSYLQKRNEIDTYKSRPVEIDSVELAESTGSTSEFRVRLKKVKTSSPSPERNQKLGNTIGQTRRFKKLGPACKLSGPDLKNPTEQIESLLKVSIDPNLKFFVPFQRTTWSQFKLLRSRKLNQTRKFLLSFQKFLGAGLLFESDLRGINLSVESLEKFAFDTFLATAGYTNSFQIIANLGLERICYPESFRNLTLGLSQGELNLFAITSIFQLLKKRFEQIVPRNMPSLLNLEEGEYEYLFTLYYFGKKVYDLEFDSLLKKFSTMEVFRLSVKKYLARQHLFTLQMNQIIDWRNENETAEVFSPEFIENLTDSPNLLNDINEALLGGIEQLSNSQKWMDSVNIRSEANLAEKPLGIGLLAVIINQNHKIIEDILSSWEIKDNGAFAYRDQLSVEFMKCQISESTITDSCKRLITSRDIYQSFLHTFVEINRHYQLTQRSKGTF